MSRGSFLYGLWCLAIIAGFLAASAYAWSPFADGGRSRTAYGVYGPTHK